MEKKAYCKPLAEILTFKTEDILSGSIVINPGVGGGDETEMLSASEPNKPLLPF